MPGDRHAPDGLPDDALGLVEQVATQGPAATLIPLAASLVDDRLTLLRAMADGAHGLRALLDLREAFLTAGVDNPDLAVVGDDLESVLAHHFAPLSLEFRTIDADAPASVLATVVEHESVHPVRDGDDLSRRLDPVDRRCFALVNPTLGPEPLVFVEVALTQGIETSVEAILDEPPRAEPGPVDTAMFYAIVKCEPGLRSIAIGPELLHRSMDELGATTTVRTFCTLSPVPGLAGWTEAPPEDDADLLRHAARFLLTARRGDEPADPVARFHLGNGACIEQINLDGNRSETGRATSLGLTVNYRYDRPRLRDNQAAYDRGEVVASAAVRSLVEGP